MDLGHCHAKLFIHPNLPALLTAEGHKVPSPPSPP